MRERCVLETVQESKTEADTVQERGKVGFTMT